MRSLPDRRSESRPKHPRYGDGLALLSLLAVANLSALLAACATFVLSLGRHAGYAVAFWAGPVRALDRAARRFIRALLGTVFAFAGGRPLASRF